MFDHKKKTPVLRIAAALLSAVVLCCAAPAALAAGSLDELLEKKERLQVQKDIADQRLEELIQDTQEKQAREEELTGEIDALQGELDALRKESETLSGQVYRLEGQLSGKQQQIQRDRDLLKARIRALYVTGEPSAVAAVLDSTSLVEVTQKAQLLKTITRHDQQLITRLNGEIKAIQGDLAQLETDKKQLAQHKKSIEAKSARLVELYNEAQALAADAQQQQWGVQAIADTLDVQIQENDDAIAQLEIEIYGRRITGATVGTGAFIWPMPGYTLLTCQFGEGGHRGIDIAGGDIYGKPVVASDGGTVLYAGWNDSYGYCVFIDHGNGFETRYAHMSELAVSTGENVDQSQIIGYAGSTGNSTGPHLHFEVIENGGLQNPMNFF